MTCSIVMTTYNGERYVRQQLDSLLAQTLPPDEVLIFDDGSTDGTVPLIQAYIRQRGLAHWRLTCNPQNLGWKRNFMQGLAQARGDLLFPCDQDDVWLPEKLAELCRIMARRPEICLLASNVQIVYEAGAVKSRHPQGGACRAGGQAAPYGFTRHFFMCPRPGCTYAVRRTFFAQVSAYWQPDFPHDEFLWISALLCGGAWLYDKPLIQFRRHGSNCSDIRYKDIPMQRQQLAYIGRALQAFVQMAEGGVLGPAARAHLPTLRQAQTWQRARMRLMETRNPLRWLLLAPWWGYYNSPQNCLSDLWLVLFYAFKR